MAFVVAFTTVLNYDAAETFQMTSAMPQTVNQADELGVMTCVTLGLGVDPFGTSPMAGNNVCVDTTRQGPFEPGVNRVVNPTLPGTASIFPGKGYALGLQGFHGSGELPGGHGSHRQLKGVRRMDRPTRRILPPR